MPDNATDTMTLLARVPFFRAVTADELRLIFAVGTERHLAPGTVLGHGGQRLDVLWVILDGQVAVTSPLMGSVSTVTGPQVWGVASLVEPFTPNGTAATVTECRMLQLNAADVRLLAQQNPRLGTEIYLALATHVFRRLRELTRGARERA